jgi:hypothetical protein
MASARIFEHNGFAGRNVLIDNPGHQRYLLATFGFLNGLNFNDITSSVQLRSGTPGTPSMCILFEHSRFNGNFKAFAYNGNRDVNSLPGFNDVTSSVLLMDHNPSANRSTFALRSLAGPRLNAAIDAQLGSISDASRNGDVRLIFTIDLFEVSLFGVDLMLIEVPVRIHTPWPFSDYDAKIRYWIRFFLDSEHRVRAFVAAWGYWIEGGILTGSIEGRLRPQVEANIGTVETQVNNMLTELEFHRWTDVYLMPGNAQVTADYDGNVIDDCTLVLPY